MKPKQFTNICLVLALRVDQPEPEIPNVGQNRTIGRPLKNGGGVASVAAKNRSHEQFSDDFWARVDIRSKDECWEWKCGRKSRKKLSYGVVWIPGENRHEIASRIAYRLFYGKDAGELFVCHKCDNPPCCNPHHFFLGTNKENCQDSHAKGRATREMGSARYNAKLTEEQVARIKREAQQGNMDGVGGLPASLEYAHPQSATLLQDFGGNIFDL